MKLFIVGHRGWIGNKYIEECKKRDIKYYVSKHRADTHRILDDIKNSGATHVISCIGRTHGIRNGVKYGTIDYLQHNDRLYENINDNLYAPLNMALFCQDNGIHYSYIGTGCIFSYDSRHKLSDSCGYKETDNPNFKGSNYSIVKGFTDRIMRKLKILNLRIRMPITDEVHPRNFITKITKYEKICSIPNSMSVLPELIPLSIEMMKNNEIGTFNFTNPGVISHNEILEMYRYIVDNTFKWKNFTIEEQDKILLSKRSNNYLDTKKLESKYKVRSIKEAVYDILVSMKNNI